MLTRIILFVSNLIMIGIWVYYKAIGWLAFIAISLAIGLYLTPMAKELLKKRKTK